MKRKLLFNRNFSLCLSCNLQKSYLFFHCCFNLTRGCYVVTPSCWNFVAICPRCCTNGSQMFGHKEKEHWYVRQITTLMSSLQPEPLTHLCCYIDVPAEVKNVKLVRFSWNFGQSLLFGHEQGLNAVLQMTTFSFLMWCYIHMPKTIGPM